MFFVSSKMKVAYVDMIVFMYVIQILIGSSHGIPARNCTATTCGDNEQCHEYDDRSISCTCSEFAYRNHATDQCVVKYNWVNYDPKLLSDPRLMQFEKGSDRYHGLGRLSYDNGDILPGEMEVFFKKPRDITFFFIAHNGYNKPEVLLIDSGTTKWIYSSNGVIENNAIIGGKKENEIIYICRIYIYPEYIIGWMQPSKRSCYVSRKPNSRYESYKILTVQIG